MPSANFNCWQNKMNDVVYRFFSSYGIYPHLYVTTYGRQPLKWPPHAGIYTLVYPFPLEGARLTDLLLMNKILDYKKKKKKWPPPSAYSCSLPLRKARCQVPCCKLPMRWAQMLKNWRWSLANSQQRTEAFSPTSCKEMTPATTTWISLEADPSLVKPS